MAIANIGFFSIMALSIDAFGHQLQHNLSVVKDQLQVNKKTKLKVY